MKNYIIQNFLPIRFLSEEEESTDSIKLSLETLVLSLMLIIYITSGPLLKKSGVKILHASGFTMIIGFIFTFIVKILFTNSNFFKGFQFNRNLFFTFILPWIIFSAGYNLKIESFLKYFRYIILFSFSGTLISFLIISVFTYILNKNQIFSYYENSSNGNYKKIILDFTVLEILQFSAAVSATDTISAVSLLMEDNEPKLNAISFGDSVINNAISIALFRIVSRVSANDDEKLSFSISIEILIKCILLFIFSLMIGALVGIFFSRFLIYMKKFHLNRVQEISLMLLFAFISYTLCDLFNISPMISLLACGLTMSHYAYYNLNYQTREESALVSVCLNIIAEALVFSSLGMTILYFTYHSFSLNFVIYELIIIILCRIFTIFGQIYIIENIFNSRKFKLKLSHKSILTVVGSIRGAISFGLAISIHSNNNLYRDILISSCIYIVFLTNVILIAILPSFKRTIKQIDNQSSRTENIEDVSDDKIKEEDIVTFMHPNTEIGTKKIKKKKSLEEMKIYEESLVKKFEDYDNSKLMPKFVQNWPQVKIDNNNVSMLIKKALGEWAKNKKQNNTYKNSDTIGFEVPGLLNQNNLYNNNNINSDNLINNNNIESKPEGENSQKFEMKEIK